MTERLDRIEATLESLTEQGRTFDRWFQETRAIVDSNAKAILANSSAIAELSTAVREINTATNARIDRLTQLIKHYFNYQAGTNQMFINGLERLEVIAALGH